MGGDRRRVLIIGGGFSGLFTARDLKNKFDVTVVDAKEFFEYTPGILRAFVKPAHFDSLTFTLNDVLERKMGVKFIWGEVKFVNGKEKTATVKPIYAQETEEVAFDYCVIASGCNFNFLHKWGESLWFPTIYEAAIPEGSWGHIDERFLEGRRRHIMEENAKLKALNKKSATVLVCGAGFIGVEWATELQHFFPNLKITIIDFLPNCLGPLPKAAQDYCDNYMADNGIKCFYGVKYDPKDLKFWSNIELPNGADEIYLCMGVKASSHFMPKDTLSDKGPGGGGWIYMNKHLQVTTKTGELLGDGSIYAVGDCNYGCIGSPDDWKSGKGMYPIPKISYPAEEQALHAVRNIKIQDAQKYGAGGCCGSLCVPKNLKETWWPWGAGMFATSLGTHDACFVAGANHNKGSGLMCVWGWPCAIQKELIETSKVDESKNNFIGWAIWHFVHHTPIQLWGKGPFNP
eukprot:GEMP01022350.1.p1 GENE.GEMP01022350.1~~GEMP01022350.1.p1  ORF type:complete len:459 (+),score=103.00 GEMP01022350.1:146-1522(+)